MDGEMEYAELRAQLEFCKNLVKRSNVYRKLVLGLEKNTAIKNCITDLMGPYRNILMVVYKLGSIQYSWASKFRLAFALSLRQRFSRWIEGIEIIEPALNVTEYRVIKNSACHVSLRNDQGSRRVDRPILFFLPNPDSVMYENLLAANWCPSRLNQIMTIGISLKYMLERLGCQTSEDEEEEEDEDEDKDEEEEEEEEEDEDEDEDEDGMAADEVKRRTMHLKAIERHVQEFPICREMDGLYHDAQLMDHIGEDFLMDNRHNESEDPNNEEEEDSHEYSDTEMESDEPDELEVFGFAEDPPCSAFATHFFRLGPNINMEALYPGVSSIELMPHSINIRSPDDTNRYFDPDVTSMDGLNLEEALRLEEEIRMTMAELKESEAYIEFRAFLMDDVGVKSNILRVLGFHDNIKMVIYGIGSIEWEDESQYQLALALLLREHTWLPIGDIEIYDPVMSPTEMKACSALGCKVLLVNEDCRRRAMQPTLFYVPGLYENLIANLIEANLHPSQLNRMILMDLAGKTEMTEIDEMIRRGENGLLLPRATDEEERLRFRWVAQKYMGQEIEILCTRGMPSHFLDLYLNFFEVDANVDLKALVPRVSLRKKVYLDYYHDDSSSDACLLERAGLLRACANGDYPIKCRYAWHPPHSGWIKLNFDGFTDGTDGRAGYGGAFHDEHGTLILMYAGPLEHADTRMANVEALRQGLRCLRHLPTLPNLMIEGQALGIIRWAKRIFAPPASAAEAFEEINAILIRVEHMIGQVYKEANQLAQKIARKGARQSHLRVWALPGSSSGD